MAKSEDKVRHEPDRIDPSNGKLVLGVISTPVEEEYELQDPLQVSTDKAADDAPSLNN